ncbi:hypothetical protein ACFL5K_01880 [Gemmatimonadota bacterium]
MRKRKSVEPLHYSNALIDRVKRVNLYTGELVRKKRVVMPGELKGQRIDLWVFDLGPSEKFKRFYF